MVKKILTALLLGTVAAAQAATKNLWPDDGSFETGHSLFIQNVKAGDAYDGEYALYVPPETTQLTGGYAPVILEKGPVYVFSAWLKSPVDVTVFPAIWTENYCPATFNRQGVKLKGGIWKKIVFHITADCGVSIRFNLRKPAGVPLLIDAIKLSLRDSGPGNDVYTPVAPVTAGVLRNDGLGEVLLEDERPVTRLFRIRNNSGETRRIQGSVALASPNSSTRELWKGEVELAPGGYFEKQLELLPHTASGYYVVRTSVTDNQNNRYESSMPFVVTKPPRKSADPFMGMHAWSGPTERLKRIGCKAERRIVPWTSVNYHDGIYQQEPVERGFLQQCSMNVAHVHRAAEKNPDGSAAPEALDKFICDYFRGKPASVLWIDLENEPDLTWRFCGSNYENATHYGRYMLHFARSIRKIMPEAKVGGGGVSGDDFNSHYPFLRRVMELAGNVIDVVTLHPYAHARYISEDYTDIGPEANGTWKKTQEARDIINAAGAGKEMLFGEVGWALDVRSDWLSEPAIRHGQYLARLFLIARALNLVSLQYFMLDEHFERGYYYYGIWRNTLPLPAAAAYAAAAQRLDGAGIVSVLENDMFYLYVFRDADGRLFCAGWTTDKLPVEIDLPFAPGSVKFSDWLGREFPVKGTKFELTQGPCYWIAQDNDDKSFLEALEKRSINRIPLAVHRRPVSRNKVAFDFENRGMKPFNGTLFFNGEQRNLKLDAPQATGWRLRPVSMTQEFRVRDAGAAATLRIVDQKGKNFTLKFRDDPLLPLNTELPVMNSRNWVLPNDPGIGYDGAEDLSIRSRLSWTEKSLILDLEVEDDVHDARTSNVWAADSVQLAIDPKVNGGSDFNSDDYEFGFAIDDNGKATVECYFAPPGSSPGELARTIKAAGNRKGTTTRYHIEIPWSTLKFNPVPGSTIALNFIVNDADADGRGRAYWMGLTPGIGEGKNPGVYRKFVLE